MKIKQDMSVRVIAESGRISFRLVKIDDKGEVQCVANEELLSAKTYQELMQLLELMFQNSSKPCVHVNGCNREIYKWTN
jgi:hypothetical protein